MLRVRALVIAVAALLAMIASVPVGSAATERSGEEVVRFVLEADNPGAAYMALSAAERDRFDTGYQKLQVRESSRTFEEVSPTGLGVQAAAATGCWRVDTTYEFYFYDGLGFGHTQLGVVWCRDAYQMTHFEWAVIYGIGAPRTWWVDTFAGSYDVGWEFRVAVGFVFQVDHPDLPFTIGPGLICSQIRMGYAAYWTAPSCDLN
jgi:hypothetical protein